MGVILELEMIVGLSHKLRSPTPEAIVGGIGMTGEKPRCATCGAIFEEKHKLDEHERAGHPAADAAARAEPNDALGTPRQVERRNRKFERSNWE
jgi:hypothetical protein